MGPRIPSEETVVTFLSMYQGILAPQQLTVVFSRDDRLQWHRRPFDHIPSVLSVFHPETLVGRPLGCSCNVLQLRLRHLFVAHPDAHSSRRRYR